MHGGNFLVKDNPLSIDQMAFGVTAEPLTGLHHYIFLLSRGADEQRFQSTELGLEVLSNDVN